MPTYICKIERDGRPLYFDWSTIVDAPTTFAMPLDEYREHYREQYGEHGMRDLPERIARADENGTSSRVGDTLESLAECNRAGRDETALTLQQIIDYVCSGVDDPPVGASR